MVGFVCYHLMAGWAEQGHAVFYLLLHRAWLLVGPCDSNCCPAPQLQRGSCTCVPA